MHQENHIIKTIESSKAIVGLRDDGIYHIFIKDNVLIDVALQEEVLSMYKSLLGNETGLLVLEVGEKCKLSKSARANSDFIHLQSPTQARAIYVQNMVYRMAASFYYRLTNVKKDYKIVLDFDEGLRFLEGYRVACPV